MSGVSLLLVCWSWTSLGAVLANAASSTTPTAKSQCQKGARVLGCGAGDKGTDAARAAFRRLLRLHGTTGTLSGGLLELRAVDSADPAAGLGVFARVPIRRGQVLAELPLSRVLWRETVDLPALGVVLPSGSPLSEAERLVLYLAALRRRVARRDAAGSAFEEYAELLLATPVPDSTVLWSIDELAWLRGTDAGELSRHFLSQIARIHSTAPEIADLDDLKVAFVQYNARHFRLWLGGSIFSPERIEAVMLPGVDMCRSREGGIKPFFEKTRRVVRIIADDSMQPGDEIYVDFGTRDHTDFVVGFGSLANYDAGIFLPVPLDINANGGVKGRLLEQLRWPAEVRLLKNETYNLRVLRLAVMPHQEFSAWTVGALVATAPIAVSRAFRTEVLATTYLLSECKRRGSAVRLSHLQQSISVAGRSADRLRVANLYNQLLLDIYGRCQTSAGDKLHRLKKWASRQHPWALTYAEDAQWQVQSQAPFVDDRQGHQVLSVEPPKHVDPEDLHQRMTYATVVALVNSRAREFVPYFGELLQTPMVSVHGFVGVNQRLQKIKKLATSIVQLKGPACGGVDLSAFNWINELRGEEDVFTTLQYLLPEMDDLVKEFVDLEPISETKPWC